jgi:hypothetical protein
MTEYSHMHQAPLSSKVQQELMVEEARYLEARARILAGSQAHPVVPQQHNMLVSVATNFGANVTTDAFTYGFPSTHTHPSQSLVSNNVMNDTRDHHGFHSSNDAWDTQTYPQTVFDPSFFSGYTQNLDTFDATSSGFPYTNASCSYPPYDIQQPVMEQMALGLPTNVNPSFDPEAYLQQASTPCLSALGQTGSTRMPLVHDGGAQFFPGLDAMRTAFACSHGIDMAASNTVLPLRNDALPSGYDMTNRARNEVPHLPAMEQPSSFDRRLCPESPSENQAPTMNISRKRALSSPTAADNETFAPYGVSNDTTKTRGELIMVSYTNPEAERAAKKARGASRTVREKADWACFRCFILQQKVCHFSFVPKSLCSH